MKVPIEIGLLGAALSAELPRRADESDSGQRHRVAPEAGEELRILGDGTSVAVRSRPPSFVVCDEDREEEIPWFLPVRLPDAPVARASVLRVGIAGGMDHRRLRMSWKTIAELRSRRFPFVAIVLGACELPATAEERPDEIHEDLEPADFLYALGRVDAILECTDGFGSESFLAIAARDAGIPVVAHSDRPDLARTSDVRSERWSADGFAEAVQAVSRNRLASLDPAIAISKIMKLIGSG